MNTMSSHHGRHQSNSKLGRKAQRMGGGDQGLYDPKNENWKPSLF